LVVLLTIIILSYLTGSIPTSIITGKLLKGIDIRDHGSGNAGATNVYRLLGWKAGVFVSIVDIGKGTFATLVISSIRYGGDALPIDIYLVQLIAGVSVVIGHMWTIFAGFKGGKGVATAAGMILGLYPFAVIFSLCVFAIAVFLTGFVSLGSILASATLPVTLFILERYFSQEIPDFLFWFSVGVASMIIIAHHSNIRRLINGTESSFKKKKNNPSVSID